MKDLVSLILSLFLPFSIPDHKECLCAPSSSLSLYESRLVLFLPPFFFTHSLLSPSLPFFHGDFVSLERMFLRSNVPKRVLNRRRAVLQELRVRIGVKERTAHKRFCTEARRGPRIFQSVEAPTLISLSSQFNVHSSPSLFFSFLSPVPYLNCILPGGIENSV